MLQAEGVELHGQAPVDLGDPEQARDWVDTAVAAHALIDILYNNASAARFGPVGEFSIEDWHYTIRNELDLIFFTTQEGKIYLDAGTREMGGHWSDQTHLRSRSRRYYGRVRRIKRILVKKGYRPTRNLLHVEDVGGGHNEGAWAYRLPQAIRFFLEATLKKAP